MEPTVDKHILSVDKDGTYIHRRGPAQARKIEPEYKDQVAPPEEPKDSHVPHKDLRVAKSDVIMGARFMGRRLARMVSPTVDSNADEVVRRTEVSAKDIAQARKLAKSEVVRTMAQDLLTAETLADKLLTSDKSAAVFLRL